jgi:sulfide:quinone oxidoreductase
VDKKVILIIGAGTAGITCAARFLKSSGESLTVTLIDPQKKHYYQPLWTLVGAGVFPHSKSEKSMEDILPEGATLISASVTAFIPEKKQVILSNGSTMTYDLLVVAAGIQLDWDKIKGAREALGYENVCSNYDMFGSTKTWEVLQQTTEGMALFTQPPMPIKCAGAPQKAAYLAEDHFRRRGIRKNVEVVFASAAAQIFGVEKYRISLEEVIRRKEIDARYQHTLIEIKPKENVAVFSTPATGNVELSYSMLHFVPPMSSPEFIKSSPLSDAAGWVEVDKFNLQHLRYPDVFALGDCSSLPTSRTGAAIRKQAPVLVANALAYLQGKPLAAAYDGYASCPLVTGYGSVILAEFDYDGKPAETFPFDQSKESWFMWVFKAYLLPVIYWSGMLKGRA